MPIANFFLYANFDYAGTNRFKHHILEESADRTLCGLRLKELRGQWEFDDFIPDNVGCIKCKKAYETKPLLPTRQ
jgi:hypothetical protein